MMVDVNETTKQAVIGWDLSRVVFRDLERDYPVVERGEGIYLFDTKGRKYIDGSGGSSVVTSIGHGNKRVAAVMAEQAGTIAFSPAHCFANQPHIELCQKIAEIAPKEMGHTFLLSGGSEATENAVKFARQYEFVRNNRGKYTVIGRWQGFHGNTFGSMTVSGITYRRQIYGPMMGHSVKIPPCYCYRCDWGLTYGNCNLECAGALKKAIRQEGPENVLAFIAEPVVGAALGAVPAVPEYFPLVREICDEFDVLFIADEVMTGFGRTGANFGVDHWRVTPDIIATAKGISGGYTPLAAVLLRDKIIDMLRAQHSNFRGGHTYCANPLSARVGLEVLAIIREQNLIENSRRMGLRLLEGLRKLLDHPTVGDVRGKGLMAGVEFVRNKKTKEPFPVEYHFGKRVFEEAFARGLVVFAGSGSVDGVAGDHILLAPPFIITESQVDDFLAILDEAVGAVEKALPNELRG
jgi:adenosylmethionine-8-amino-7-oxononanoate aminotransferase